MVYVVREREHTAISRAGYRQWTLKPQDLAVVIKLVVLDGRQIPYRVLARYMQLSPYEVNAAVKRLLQAGLLALVGRSVEPVRITLLNFIIHGARHAYPPIRGEVTIGFPTAHAAAPLKHLSRSAGIPFVWPHPDGSTRGQTLVPLYSSLPIAAVQDASFHEFLAVFDVLRVGQAREREAAVQWLRKKLG